jgi:prefoldin alpha subunit
MERNELRTDVEWLADKDLFSGRPILVPLTTSLYVPGKLADSENVIVDVGTGFYVEKVYNL